MMATMQLKMARKDIDSQESHPPRYQASNANITLFVAQRNQLLCEFLPNIIDYLRPLTLHSQFCAMSWPDVVLEHGLCPKDAMH